MIITNNKNLEKKCDLLREARNNYRNDYQTSKEKIHEQEQIIEQMQSKLVETRQQVQLLTNSLKDAAAAQNAVKTPGPPPRPVKEPVSALSSNSNTLQRKDNNSKKTAISESSSANNFNFGHLTARLNSLNQEDSNEILKGDRKFTNSNNIAPIHMFETSFTGSTTPQVERKSNLTTPFPSISKLSEEISGEEFSKPNLPGLKTNSLRSFHNNNNNEGWSNSSRNHSISGAQSIQGGNSSMICEEEENTNSAFGVLSARKKKMVGSQLNRVQILQRDYYHWFGVYKFDFLLFFRWDKKIRNFIITFFLFS